MKWYSNDLHVFCIFFSRTALFVSVFIQLPENVKDIIVKINFKQPTNHKHLHVKLNVTNTRPPISLIIALCGFFFTANVCA